MCPLAPVEGRRKAVGNFLRHEIYKNSVSSLEAGDGMEGQIIEHYAHFGCHH